jgi:hypothetical protein
MSLALSAVPCGEKEPDMKRTMFAWTVSMLVMAAPLLSAQHGGSAPKPTSHGSSSTHGTTSTHVTSPSHGSTTHGSTTHVSSTHGGTTHGSSGSHGGSTHGQSTSHGSSMKSAKTTTSAKTNTTSTKTSTKATTKTARVETEHAKDKHTETDHAELEHGDKKRTTTATTTTSTTLTPVQQKLQRNTNLASKLQSRLPAGTDLNTAAAGFRNLGQFVAAVNVSNNLGIPFAQLKTRMVDQKMSLGQAIQDARPATTNTTTVAGHAETEADDMIRATTPTTPSTSTSTSKTAKPKRSHSGS